MRRATTTALFSTILAAPALAGELALTVAIPRLDVSEYHRPYLAAWIEGADGRAIANLAVWYDIKKRDNEGVKWLKDLRQWWRRIGRETDLPLDGVSGATRPVGDHTLRFDTTASPLTGLQPGSYEIVVEAAREVGDREVVRLPLAWPPAGPAHAETRGKLELGTVSVSLKP